LLLPDSGVTSTLPIIIATIYLLSALILLRKSKFSAAATN
jgi:hypothetical protein